MSPDPCDAREANPDPGFALPCRCGAAVERDYLAHQLDTAIQDLARAHGRTPAAERAARGLTQGPHTTTVRGPSPSQEGRR